MSWQGARHEVGVGEYLLSGDNSWRADFDVLARPGADNIKAAVLVKV